MVFVPHLNAVKVERVAAAKPHAGSSSQFFRPANHSRRGNTPPTPHAHSNVGTPVAHAHSHTRAHAIVQTHQQMLQYSSTSGSSPHRKHGTQRRSPRMPPQPWPQSSVLGQHRCAWPKHSLESHTSSKPNFARLSGAAQHTPPPPPPRPHM